MPTKQNNVENIKLPNATGAIPKTKVDCQKPGKQIIYYCVNLLAIFSYSF